jgi:hypothetical protein
VLDGGSLATGHRGKDSHLIPVRQHRIKPVRQVRDVAAVDQDGEAPGCAWHIETLISSMPKLVQQIPERNPVPVDLYEWLVAERSL